MMSLRTDAGLESLPSFTNGRIEDCLLHVRPHLDQTLFQLVHVTYGFLDTASNHVIDRVKVSAVRQP